MSASSNIEERLASERLRLAAELSGMGFWELDLVADETHWDERTRRILGAPLQGPIQQADFYDRLHLEDRERVRAEVELSYDPEVAVYDTEYRVVSSDGTVRWVRARGRTVFDEHDNPVRFLGVVFDATREKEREQTLARLTREAQRASAAKDDFLAMVGHELRNPLSTILLGAQILARKATHEPDVVKRIGRQARLLKRIVDDLLDAARISHGKLTVQKSQVPLASIVNVASEIVAPSLEGRDQHLVIEGLQPDQELIADRERMVQVLANLIENASKFSRAGQAITLRVTAEGSHVTLSVIDEGAGIAPERLESLFHPFEQSTPSSERREGGLGLGLSIVKEIVERHGGSIRAESGGLGQGAAFHVRLSLSPSLPPTPVPSTVRLKVLLVDDDDDYRNVLLGALEAAGHLVWVAANGTQAMDRGRSVEPDIAVLDVGLPDHSGYHVARVLREAVPSLKIIAVSAYAPTADKSHLRVLFDDYLVKPASLDDVLTAIKRVQAGLA